MDLASVIGFVAVWVLLGAAMLQGAGIGPYVDIPSVLITFGGSISALMIAYKMEHIKGFVKFFLLAFKPPQTFDVPALVKKLVDYSTQARRDGILSLEQSANQEENDFLRKGLGMAIDGGEADTIRELLELDMDQALGSDMFKSIATSPISVPSIPYPPDRAPHECINAVIVEYG